MTERRPTLWRVKDFADGWIYFAREIDARIEAERTGAAIEPVYRDHDALGEKERKEET